MSSELLSALEKGDLNEVKRLLPYSSGSQYLLPIAVLSGQLPVVVYLLLRGVDTHLDDALAAAATLGDLDIVRVLTPILKERLPSAVDEALISASLFGRLPVAMYLLSQGADIHAKRNRALKVAAREDHCLLTEFLLDMTTRLPERLTKRLVSAVKIAKMLEGTVETELKDGTLSKLIARYY